MICPQCGSEHSRVFDSRSRSGCRMRRRVCIDCGRRFTTYESCFDPDFAYRLTRVLASIDTGVLIEAASAAALLKKAATSSRTARQKNCKNSGIPKMVQDRERCRPVP